MQDETSTPSPKKLPLFLQDQSPDTDFTDDNASTKDGDCANDKVYKQDETTINVDIGSEVVVSGSVPTPETEKRNNKVKFLVNDAENRLRRRVSYVDNHSW